MRRAAFKSWITRHPILAEAIGVGVMTFIGATFCNATIAPIDKRVSALYLLAYSAAIGVAIACSTKLFTWLAGAGRPGRE
jgi:hypothetical protein